MARKKRQPEGESDFWRGYERADAMKIRKPRMGGTRSSVRPKSFRPRKKSYRRRGRR